MIWRYSKSLDGFMQVWTIDDIKEYGDPKDKELWHLIFKQRYKSCSVAELIKSKVHPIIRCSYSTNVCGNRDIIYNEVMDDKIYTVEHGCCGINSKLFGVKLIGKSLYSKCYAHNKI